MMDQTCERASLQVPIWLMTACVAGIMSLGTDVCAASAPSVDQKQPKHAELVFDKRADSAPVEAPKQPKTVSVRDYGAKGDGLQDDAAAIQAALDGDAATVTIPAGIYRIGQTLRIGSGTTLQASPQAVIRLADAAGSNVNVFLIMNRYPDRGDKNITIDGGIWDGNNEYNARGSTKPCYTGVAINFVNVYSLTLRNLIVRNPDSFAIRACRLSDFMIENVGFDFSVLRGNQDGIHLNGHCYRGVIRNLYAISPFATNDDMVALNADDGMDHVLCQGMVAGPIEGITVEKIRADSAYTFVRLLCVNQRIKDVVIGDVRGGCRAHAINIDRWRFPLSEKSGLIENVTLRDITVNKVLYPTMPVLSGVPMIPVQVNVRNLRIENFQRGDDGVTNAMTFVLDSGQTNHLHITGLTSGQQQALLQKTPALTAAAFTNETQDADSLLTLDAETSGKVVLPAGGFSSLEVSIK